ATAQSAAGGGLVQPSVLRGGMADSSKQVEEDIRGRVPDLQRLFREYPTAPPDTS
ncbi:unnamed protein product, partial [Scytosiphon promiscuus]